MGDSSVTEMVPLVRELVRLAMDRRHEPGMVALDRRLQALLDAPHPLLTIRSRRQAGMEIERRIWSQALVDILLPEVRAQLVLKLRTLRLEAGLSTADDPWGHLDDEVREESDRRRTNAILQMRSDIVDACRRYERTTKIACLRDAVQRLEDALALERRPDPYVLTEASCAQEASCLHAGLRRVLPPSAVCLTVGLIRAHIHRTVASYLRQPRPSGGGFEAHVLKGEQWLSRDGWTRLDSWENWSEGTWFVERFQARYAREMDAAVQREKEEKRRKAKVARVGNAPIERISTVEQSPQQATERALDDGHDIEAGATDTADPSAESGLKTPIDRVTIHFVDEGLTAFGRIWYPGMELSLDRGSAGWMQSCDVEGRSWVEMTEQEQQRRYGKVLFKPGPWPGEPWGKEATASFRKDFSAAGSWERDLLRKRR